MVLGFNANKFWSSKSGPRGKCVIKGFSKACLPAKYKMQQSKGKYV